MAEPIERQLSSDMVAALAVAAGVPLSAIPVVVNVDVHAGRAVGWASTLYAERPWDAPVSPDWPDGRLTLVGAVVDTVPDEHDRPYVRVEDVAIAAYMGVLLLPNERTQVSVRWPAGQDTTTTSSTAGSTAADRRAASQAAQWLEALPSRAGAPAESTPAVRAEYLEAARAIVNAGDTLDRKALANKTGRSVSRTNARMRQHGVGIRGLKKALRENS